MKFIKKMNKKKKLMFFGGIALVIGFIIAIVLIVSGNVQSNSIEGLTKAYMKKYQRLDKEVVDKIKYEFGDKLTADQKQKYKSIIENQYEELEYEIVEVRKSGVTGEVDIRFTVYDLASAMEQANSYIAVYGDKFMKDGKFDEYAAIDYKLKMLDEVETKVDYTITFNFYKEDGTWTMDDVVEADLKKIRGTF